MAKYVCKDFNDIASCFTKLHTHIDSEVEKLQCQQEETRRKVELLENQAEFVNSEIDAIHNKHLPNLESKIEQESVERMKLELWGRKWNVIIRGLNGKDIEDPKITQTCVRIFLSGQLGLGVERVKDIPITAVHRLSSGPTGKRNIILRLASLIDRDDILKAAMKLPAGSGYSIVPDLPPTLATRRGELLKERRDMPAEERKKYRLVYLKEPPFLKLVMRKTDRP